MSTRRGFLKSILALGAAPAIVRAENLMKIWVPPQKLYSPLEFGDMVWRPELVRVLPLQSDGPIVVQPRIHPNPCFVTKEMVGLGPYLLTHLDRVYRFEGLSRM